LIRKFLADKESKKKERSSNFECGFESQSYKNTFISGQFFIISILFIIFDIEITLIIPIMQNDINNNKIL
jgi:NADH-ubiquinone oxidoreductase chain 3